MASQTNASAAATVEWRQRHRAVGTSLPRGTRLFLLMPPAGPPAATTCSWPLERTPRCNAMPPRATLPDSPLPPPCRTLPGRWAAVRLCCSCLCLSGSSSCLWQPHGGCRGAVGLVGEVARIPPEAIPEPQAPPAAQQARRQQLVDTGNFCSLKATAAKWFWAHVPGSASRFMKLVAALYNLHFDTLKTQTQDLQQLRSDSFLALSARLRFVWQRRRNPLALQNHFTATHPLDGKSRAQIIQPVPETGPDQQHLALQLQPAHQVHQAPSSLQPQRTQGPKWCSARRSSLVAASRRVVVSWRPIVITCTHDGGRWRINQHRCDLTAPAGGGPGRPSARRRLSLPGQAGNSGADQYAAARRGVRRSSCPDPTSRCVIILQLFSGSTDYL